MRPAPSLLLRGKTGARDQHWQLDREEHFLGRDADLADIVIQAPQVSRRHARIVRENKVYLLADLDSRNGTFIGGRRLGAEPQRLHSLDEIVLGGAVTLRFLDPNETAQATPIGKLRGVWLDLRQRDVFLDGKRLEPSLPVRQFDLLALLAEGQGAVVEREALVARLWPASEYPAGVSDDAFDALVKRLRARLREAWPAHEPIAVVRGVGLRLDEPAR